MPNDAPADLLLKKIMSLPPERIVEVEDFVDFLRSRVEEDALTQSVSALSEPRLNDIWDNPEDAAYDQL